jgi:hypothetical protein
MAEPVEGALVPMSLAHGVKDVEARYGFQGDVQIDRFDLPPNEREVEVLTRYGTRFLPHVEASDRVPGGYTLWGLVPQRTAYGKRYARVLAVGDSVPAAALADHEYVGTFHDLGHVWHVFITKEGAR